MFPFLALLHSHDNILLTLCCHFCQKLLSNLGLALCSAWRQSVRSEWPLCIPSLHAARIRWHWLGLCLSIIADHRLLASAAGIYRQMHPISCWYSAGFNLWFVKHFSQR